MVEVQVDQVFHPICDGRYRIKNNEVDWQKLKKIIIKYNRVKVRNISASHVLISYESMNAFISTVSILVFILLYQ